MTIKEDSIRKYMANINFKNGEWGVKQLQEDMRRFLGEEPAIDVIYKKDVMVNEVSGVAKEIMDVDKIRIIFTDTNESFKSIEFLINDKI